MCEDCKEYRELLRSTLLTIKSLERTITGMVIEMEAKHACIKHGRTDSQHGSGDNGKG